MNLLSANDVFYRLAGVSNSAPVADFQSLAGCALAAARNFIFPRRNHFRLNWRTRRPSRACSLHNGRTNNLRPAALISCHEDTWTIFKSASRLANGTRE